MDSHLIASPGKLGEEILGDKPSSQSGFKCYEKLSLTKAARIRRGKKQSDHVTGLVKYFQSKQVRSMGSMLQKIHADVLLSDTAPGYLNSTDVVFLQGGALQIQQATSPSTLR